MLFCDTAVQELLRLQQNTQDKCFIIPGVLTGQESLLHAESCSIGRTLLLFTNTSHLFWCFDSFSIYQGKHVSEPLTFT